MVVEKLIKQSGEYDLPETIFLGASIGPRIFYHKWIYYYDGAKFLIGSFDNGKKLSIVEVTTGLTAVGFYELSGKTTTDKLISLFKEKLRASCVSIHQVIARAKGENLDIDLWLVNSLIV